MVTLASKKSTLRSPWKELTKHRDVAVAWSAPVRVKLALGLAARAGAAPSATKPAKPVAAIPSTGKTTRRWRSNLREAVVTSNITSSHRSATGDGTACVSEYSIKGETV
jgi:hypothetical protein